MTQMLGFFPGNDTVVPCESSLKICCGATWHMSQSSTLSLSFCFQLVAKSFNDDDLVVLFYF